MASNIKKVFAIARNAYLDWITNPRMFLFLIAVMVMINAYITPLINCSQYGVNSPLNVFEGFLTLCGEPRIVATVFSLIFIVLICDFPKMSANDTFVLVRTSKTSWVMGQCLFAFFAALTYVAALATIITIYTAPYSFFSNGWSNVTRTLDSNKEFAIQFEILAGIYPMMFNHSRPVGALLNSVGLMTLSFTLLALVILLFNLKGKKIFGVAASALIIAGGFIFIDLKSGFQWFFPMSHSTITCHNTSVIKMVPLWQSYAYFLVVIAALVALAVMFIDKYSFRFNDSSNL